MRNDNSVKLTEANNAKREAGMAATQTWLPVKFNGRPLLNPDGTFEIKPIDFDGLHDLENLTK